MQKRYVIISDASDLSILKDYLKSDSVPMNVKRRSHAILLSKKGYSVPEICDILEVQFQAVYSWFNRYESQGISGLFDKPRSGRPRTLSDAEQKKS